MEALKKLTTRAVIAISFLISLGTCIVIIYAIANNAEISISKESWLRIKPQGDDRIRELEKRLNDLSQSTVSIEEYHNLQKRLSDLEKTSINIGLLPNEVQGPPESVIEAIAALVAETRTLESDIGFSYAVVSREIVTNVTLNTQLPADNDRRKKLYKHIQKCLASIGYFSDGITGEQVKTYSAIVKLQSEMKLKPDGIIGKKTWSIICDKYESFKKEG